VVVGADLTLASLRLAEAARRRFELPRAAFVESDLFRPGLKDGAFDVVYCSGVLHHTPDPKAAFARIVRLAKPGGMIVLGLYNAVARIPLRLRRVVAKLSGYRWIPFDPVLADRANEPERREAWLRDQYMHPEEHLHTVGEVLRWFRANRVEFVRAYPSAQVHDDEPDDLFARPPTPGRPNAGWRSWAGWAAWATRAGCS
jgi:SAM-dependent methyltransferase